jgi:hypothetical protein
MNLTDLIRNLETQLKKAEKYAKDYDTQAASLRNKLSSVAYIVGRKLKVGAAAAKSTGSKSKGISAAGRARIRAAQKKRWAAFRTKGKKVAAPKAKGRGKISSAGRARIRAAQKKRWAAFRSKGKKS